MARNPNRMQEAVEKLQSVYKQNASIVVDYRQGTKTVTGISATVGRTNFDVDQGGVLTAYESRDYLIDAADLGLTPASGDTVTESNGDRYVVAIPNGLNFYESMGPLGTTLKIHTKQVA